MKALPQPLEQYLRACIKQIDFEKGATVLQKGEILDRLYFIETGWMRGEEINNGVSYTNFVLREGNICYGIMSFLDQKPSTDSIIAISFCKCWYLTYHQLEHGFKKFVELHYYMRKVMERCLIDSSTRKHLWSLPKKGRYAYLQQKDPWLAENLSGEVLESYLRVAADDEHEF